MHETVLMRFLPESVADYMTQNYDEEESYDDMEERLTDYIGRTDSRKVESSKISRFLP